MGKKLFHLFRTLFVSMDFPSEKNNFLVEHVLDIRNSYRQLLLKELIPDIQSDEEFARQLFYAPFALVSHDTASDPVFNYANLKALELFELSWEDFTCLPSRLSAESVNQAERERLLAEVTEKGYIDHYRGVRISSTGKRFLIKNAVVWNLIDKNQGIKGQAAWFDQWAYL
ncbi:MAG: MEKHLA domain-containing protein [Methylococcaceae bacterium]|nr:MEKHLA domain-containing protein [Methylococcaceae bacterium]